MVEGLIYQCIEHKCLHHISQLFFNQYHSSQSMHLINGGHGTTWELSSNSMVVDWIVECAWEQIPPPICGPFLSSSKHKRNHRWKLGGSRVNGNKLGGCGWNYIIGSHLGTFWGHSIFSHLIWYPFDTPQLSWEKMKNNGKNHGFPHCVMP